LKEKDKTKEILVDNLSYTDEELVKILQENFDKESDSFRILFKRCTKKLYTFLINKGYSQQDSEDILQDYFSSYIDENSQSNYEKAILRFDPSYGGKFINYVKRILILRLISRNTKLEQERNIISSSLNDYITTENIEKGILVGQEDTDLNNFILEEIKKIVISHIFEIDNETYKLAIICRLCLPFRITVSEIADVLEVNERTLSTSLYRGIEVLSKKLKNDLRLKNLSYEDDISKFIEHRLLHINKNTFESIFNDKKITFIFEKLLYEGKSIEELSEISCINIVEIKKILKEGIFKLISDKNNLL